MFERVTIYADDVGRAEAGYAAVAGSGPPWPDLVIEPSGTTAPATSGLHLAFRSGSSALVDEAWAKALEAGFTDGGPPGPRTQYRGDYYGGFVRDYAGNSVEAMLHGISHPVGRIDHLWIRVEDPAGLRRQILERDAVGSYDLKVDDPDLVRFNSPTGSLTIVRGRPVTRHVEVRLDDGVEIEIE